MLPETYHFLKDASFSTMSSTKQSHKISGKIWEIWPLWKLLTMYYNFWWCVSVLDTLFNFLKSCTECKLFLRHSYICHMWEEIKCETTALNYNATFQSFDCSNIFNHFESYLHFKFWCQRLFKKRLWYRVVRMVAMLLTQPKRAECKQS